MALPEKWLCHALPLVKVQRKSLHYPTMFVLDHYHFRKLSRKIGAMFAPTPSLNGQGTNCKLCPHRWRCPKLRTSSSAVGGFMDRNRILILVGGFNHLEKYEFVNGKDDIPYEMENPNHQPEYVSEYQNLSLMICVSYVDHLLTCYASLRIIMLQAV